MNTAFGRPFLVGVLMIFSLFVVACDGPDVVPVNTPAPVDEGIVKSPEAISTTDDKISETEMSKIMLMSLGELEYAAQKESITSVESAASQGIQDLAKVFDVALQDVARGVDLVKDPLYMDYVEGFAEDQDFSVVPGELSTEEALKLSLMAHDDLQKLLEDEESKDFVDQVVRGIQEVYEDAQVEPEPEEDEGRMVRMCNPPFGPYVEADEECP